MAYKNITAKEKKAVGVITLDRPDALNALCEDLIDEMAQALDDFIDFYYRNGNLEVRYE